MPRNSLSNRRLRALPSLKRMLGMEQLEARRMLALTTADLTSGLTPFDLAQALVGSGVTVTDVRYTGAPEAAGTFTGGLVEGLGIESGVILSSGRIADAAGPNLTESMTTSFDLPGDPDLDSLIPGFSTYDAAVLEFDFIATGGTISVQYVFGSEEYNEYVGLDFNDVFGFFLDGQNIALVPGTTTPVSINNVNAGSFSQYFNNNSPFDLGIPTPFLTQADGFTVVLTATATVSPGAHTIKLAVADAGDTILDSWVFLAAESFVSGESDMQVEMIASPDPVNVNNPLTYTIVATNHGPDAASNVRVENILPPDVSFVSASTSQGQAIVVDGVVNAQLGSLAVGTSATVTVVVIPTELGPLSNTATVSAAQIEPFPANNSTTLVTNVETPSISINDIQVVEGNEGTKDAVFTVSLNAPENNFTINVAYATADITANAGTDYVPRSGVLTFAPGVAQRTITVPIIGDRFNEPTETFLVALSNPANASIAKAIGIGTIIDNDPLPNFYVDDVQVTTTLAGTRMAIFTVALDWPSGREVRVDYATSDGTALAGINYQGVAGTLIFAPGVRSQQVTVPVMTNDVYSANKKFYLNLSGAVHAGLADPQGAGTLVYAAEPTGEATIDNGATGYAATAGWSTLTNTLAHQLDYDYHPPGGGGVASWTFAGLPAGEYQVFTKWIPFSNRATNAPYTIFDGETSLGTVSVNQQIAPTGEWSNGISWQNLGTFIVNGNTLRVELSSNANGYVIADAVRLVRGGIALQVPEMDVSAWDRSISTGNSTPAYDNATEFGATSLYTDSLAHTFQIHNNGNAPLLLTGNPRVQITGAHASDFHVLTQPAASVDPSKKSSFQIVFRPTGVGTRTATVSIANNDDNEHPYSFTIAGTGNGDSPGQVVIDNGQAGFSQSGSWTLEGHAQALGGNMLTSVAGAGNTWARWQFSGLSPGNYFVFTTWAPSAELASNAAFAVSSGGGGGMSIHVNQQLSPGILISGRHWTSLGAISVSNGMITVDLPNGGNGPVAADAVMILREGTVPEAGPLAHNLALPQDVNNDGRVSTGDVLIVVNSLLRVAEPMTATSAMSTQQYYVDVNGDGRLTVGDVLSVVNYLLQATAAPQVMAEPTAAAVDDFVLFDNLGDEEADAAGSMWLPTEDDDNAELSAAVHHAVGVVPGELELVIGNLEEDGDDLLAVWDW